MKNKYLKRSHISEHNFRQIMSLFAADLTGFQIASLLHLNRNTINRILNLISIRIAQICEEESIFDMGEIEIDESYFGARRVSGKAGRGAGGKTIVFGLKKRNGKVYTQVVTNCSARELIPIIKDKVSEDSTVYTDSFRTYDGLVNMGYKKHYRISHGKNEFANGRNHINGIENFWGIAKERLGKFRGMSKQTFYLHLKECEFRFNHRDEDLYKLILEISRKNPL
jgi:transposase